MTDRKNRAITVPAKGSELTRGEDNCRGNIQYDFSYFTFKSFDFNI